MPAYCYKTLTGRVIDRVFRVGKAPQRIRVDGQVAVRSIVDEHKMFPSTRGWPLVCVASGVHPDQAGELRSYLRGHGVPTDVTPDGDPVYRNPAHRKKALKARGMHDRNSFS